MRDSTFAHKEAIFTTNFACLQVGLPRYITFIDPEFVLFDKFVQISLTLASHTGTTTRVKSKATKNGHVVG